MKLGQVRCGRQVTAAIFEGKKVRLIPDYTMLELIESAEAKSVPLAALARKLAAGSVGEETPIIPIHPPEVYGCGCAYQTSAAFRDAEHGTREGFYAHVYKSPRPEIFFKGTARVCVGPGEDIGLRADSQFTAPEPEMAVVVGRQGNVLGYTIANDVSAWDIERENPLYLPQSKMFTGCCALGPVIVTTDEIPDPYNVEITATITRQGKVIFRGETSTQKLARKIEEMIAYLCRANPVPAGTVLMTGTGIIVTKESALAPGDVVSIKIPGIGELANPAKVVGQL
jgi:2-dehydro-3-deoxy-D-arabinonate dehydratase